MLYDLIDPRLILLYFLIFFPLEYLFPAHAEKRILRKGFLTDVMHYFFSGLLSKLGLFAVLLIPFTLGKTVVPSEFRLWVENLPLWLQVLSITVISDLGMYLSHRLMHTVPFLWKFHAIHHSSEQLDWLAAFRVHPVDQVILKGTSLLPIFVMGFSSASIAIAGMIYNWQSLLIH